MNPATELYMTLAFEKRTGFLHRFDPYDQPPTPDDDFSPNELLASYERISKVPTRPPTHAPPPPRPVETTHLK